MLINLNCLYWHLYAGSDNIEPWLCCWSNISLWCKLRIETLCSSSAAGWSMFTRPYKKQLRRRIIILKGEKVDSRALEKAESVDCEIHENKQVSKRGSVSPRCQLNTTAQYASLNTVFQTNSTTICATQLLNGNCLTEKPVIQKRIPSVF